ncbi:N-acetyl-D-glucosamine kinase [Trichinella spiralis]|uniref:N-acetyl-D-glucosamine kinase n=1 Tax=Trichinella spiralis TaxID=6334 RepID=UPI0001EFC44F|nr:N-acetyl-D-glucosamine kinase [Trichinella spiralis]
MFHEQSSSALGTSKGGTPAMNVHGHRRRLELELVFTMSIYYAGVDGGATKTTLILMNEKGTILAHCTGAGTNIYLCSSILVFEVVVDLIYSALKIADLPKNTKLSILALAMSGAEDQERNEKFVAEFSVAYPAITESVVIISDSHSALLTAFDENGIVLISGTGSSCRAIDITGRLLGCGGWGHLIGDDGSAYWISTKAIRKVFAIEEGLEISSHDASRIKAKLLHHFQLSRKEQIFELLYDNFSKAKIASFCEFLAEENGDELILEIFAEAGKILGAHILAIVSAMHLENSPKLEVLIMGSVWKSFDLLKKGFLNGLMQRHDKDPVIKEIVLYELTVSPAIGACRLAAKKANCSFPISVSECRRL